MEKPKNSPQEGVTFIVLNSLENYNCIDTQDVQKDVQNIVDKMKLVEEDIKGVVVDQSVYCGAGIVRLNE